MYTGGNGCVSARHASVFMWTRLSK